jgi:hypothetical protein
MKKFTSLQFMMLMSLAVGSSFVTECYGGSDKYADKSEKLGKSKSKPVAKNNAKKDDSMKCIESELRKIRRDFRKSNDRQQALDRLRALEPRIKALIARLKNSEEHGKIWETHEHTLNRKLRETREYVQGRAQKDKVEVQSRYDDQAAA